VNNDLVNRVLLMKNMQSSKNLLNLLNVTDDDKETNCKSGRTQSCYNKHHMVTIKKRKNLEEQAKKKYPKALMAMFQSKNLATGEERAKQKHEIRD
jgi:hypothetical protein